MLDRPVTGSTRSDLSPVHHPVDSLCGTMSSLCIIWVNQWISMALWGYYEAPTWKKASYALCISKGSDLSMRRATI